MPGSAAPATRILAPSAVAPQASFPAAQIGRMPCLVRWYEHMQHAADAGGVYPRVAVPVPPLSLPAPSAAAPRVRVP